MISPEELKRDYLDAAIIISNVFYDSVNSYLTSNGYTKIFDCTSLFMKINFKNYDFWMMPDYAIRNVEQYLSSIYKKKSNNILVDQIFLNITTKCTLRCKHCSSFIPYVPNPCHYKKSEIMSDLNNILDALGHIRIINFYGGEPLLHPDLAFMIQELSDEKRTDRISIITNGTIIPDEKVILAMKKEKRFYVRISDYGMLSAKTDKLKEVLTRNEIKYEIANYTYWDQPSGISYVNSSEEELREKFKLCTSCNVLFLLNRKLHLCSTGSAVYDIGGFPKAPDNYVDFSVLDENKELLKEKILEFAARPKMGRYLDACNYCTGNHCVQFEHKVPVAEQTNELLMFEKYY